MKLPTNFIKEYVIIKNGKESIITNVVFEDKELFEKIYKELEKDKEFVTSDNTIKETVKTFLMRDVLDQNTTFIMEVENVNMASFTYKKLMISNGKNRITYKTDEYLNKTVRIDFHMRHCIRSVGIIDNEILKSFMFY